MINKKLLCILFVIIFIGSSSFPGQGAETYNIYFSSDRDGNFDIYSAAYPEKGEVKKMTSSIYADTEPCVSRDGKKLVYTAYMADGSSHIFIMNSDGTDKKQLTTVGKSNRMPSFSYDGKRIVFVSTRDLNEEIYVMNADGTEQTRLTFGEAVTQPQSYDKPMPPEIEVTRDTYPSFSPDGKKIIFTSYRDGNADLFLMDSDGTDKVHLTDTTSHYHNIQAVFTPDGNDIVWASDRDGDYDLYTMKAKGPSQPAKLTEGGFGSHCPHFSKDSKKIIFCADLQGPSWAIFIMDFNGKNIEALFESFGDDWTPSIY